MRPRQLLGWLLVFAAGLGAGGSLFSRSIPRSFIALNECAGTCYRPSDLAGLLVSAGIQLAPDLVPLVEKESAECLALRHPKPEGRVHVVLFPKRDVRNILEVQSEDQPFVFGCFALAREIATAAHAENYRLVTNGPRLQQVSYLHFHLIAK